MRVWVTRAEPGATATAATLRARGHVALVAPLLTAQPIPDVRLDLDGVAALAFTSANAVRAFADLTPRRDLPVDAVGVATALAASEAGLAVRAVGQGDAAALARLILQRRSAGLLLHPAAETPAFDLVAALAEGGVEARAVAVYRTRAVPALPPPVAEALARGALDAVLVHSPRAGRALAGLVGASPKGPGRRLHVFGLSPACLVPLSPIDWGALTAADRPDEAALLDALERS